DLALSIAVMAATARAALDPRRGGGQALRDFDTVRQFLSGAAIFTLFDAPWMPVTIAVIFLLHPALGSIAVLGALALFGVGPLTDSHPRPRPRPATRQSIRFNALIEGALRNAEAIEAMGMFGNLQRRWQRLRGEMLAEQATASDRGASMVAAGKFVRL